MLISTLLQRRFLSLVLHMAPFLFVASGRIQAQEGALTIFLWHAYGEGEARGLEAAVKAFQARAQEEGRPIRVEITPVPFGAYASKLQAAIPTGKGPDLFIDAHDRLAFYVESELIRPFGAWPPELDGEFDPLHLNALRWKGVLWGLPLSIKCLVLYLNRKLAPPVPLETLEDFEALATRLPKGIWPLAWEISSTYGSAALFHAYGARHIDEAGHFTLLGPAAEAALFRMQALLAKGVVPPEGSGELVRNLFASGRAVAAVSGPWLAPDLGPELEWEVRPLPRLREPPKGQSGAMTPFATVEAVFFPSRIPQGKEDKAREQAARALAIFLAASEGARIRALRGGHIVASERAWKGLEGLERERAFREAARQAIPMPTHPLMSRVFGPVDRAIRKVLRGELEPGPALIEASHRFADETRPPPPPRDPRFAIVLLTSLLLVLLFFATRRLLDPQFRVTLLRSLPAYAWVAHALIAIFLLVVLPLGVGALTSFFAGQGRNLHYVGLANYIDILTARGQGLFSRGSFYLVLGVTILWTILNVTLHVVIGVSLALLLSRSRLFLRPIYRVLLILPWAIPNYVTALTWKGMFHRQYGAVNAILSAIGFEPVSWFARFSTAFTANLITNVWLGFPFMMVVTLGALTSIPKDLYEAAEVDGATPWDCFWRITVPMLRPALLPAITMGAVWTFNMFNVVFLVSAGEPDGSTEILVSEAYRWAFTRGNQIGYAAAYSVLIFVVLFLSTRGLPIFGMQQKNLGEKKGVAHA
ncbi:MAG: extracellular solute-binding protein [Sandaracinaceae bacterium]|nr:extracellular solute-binding protein [Sandaracinaceae bacterium]MDW8246852.1 extracellular solute-binding protein [Sandaracinaceae bacterium]